MGFYPRRDCYKWNGDIRNSANVRWGGTGDEKCSDCGQYHLNMSNLTKLSAIFTTMRGERHKIDEAVTEPSPVYYEISPRNLGMSPK